MHLGVPASCNKLGDEEFSKVLSAAGVTVCRFTGRALGKPRNADAAPVAPVLLVSAACCAVAEVVQRTMQSNSAAFANRIKRFISVSCRTGLNVSGGVAYG
jgi:hypothetical protein